MTAFCLAIASWLLISTLTAASPTCPVLGGSGSYSYVSPGSWGGTCQSGTSQSPIDFPPFSTITLPTALLGKPEPNYKTATMTVKNKTENWALECPEPYDCGYMMFDNTRFDVINLHFHAPSEHFVDGRQYPLEAHVVHKSASGALLVLGTMFDYDSSLLGIGQLFGSNSLVTAVIDGICNNFNFIVVPFPSILGTLGGSLAYRGSLTTPPCSEIVTFFIQKTVQQVTSAQVSSYIHTAGSPTGTNNRPVQPLNGRTVQRYL